MDDGHHRTDLSDRAVLQTPQRSRDSADSGSLKVSIEGMDRLSRGEFMNEVA